MLQPLKFDRFALSRLLFGLLATFCFTGVAASLINAGVKSAPGVDAKWVGNLLGIVSFQGAALIWIAYFLKEQGIGWSHAFGFRNANPLKVVMWGLFGLVLVLPTSMLVLMVSNELMNSIGISPEVQPQIQVIQQAVQSIHPTSIATRIIEISCGIMAITIVPFAEEILFRGLLYGALKEAGYPKLALFGSAFLFAEIHFSLPHILPLTVFALILTFIYEATGNLLASVIAHGLFNAVNILWTVYEKQLASFLDRVFHFSK
ncbi:MAG: Abortive infection protein [Verrucomicrobiales bacterium]|nr:Abortive infection protein [Verrucomicrobiales bacterium]